MVHRNDFLDLANKNIGHKIHDLRTVQGRTREWLAERIMCTPQQLWKYETAENRVSVPRLALIARALKTDMKFFTNDIELSYPEPSQAEQTIMTVAKNLRRVKDKDYLLMIKDHVNKLIDLYERS